MDLATLRQEGVFLRGNQVSISSPGRREAQDLAVLLGTDTLLRQNLGIPPDDEEKPTAQEVLDKLEQWGQRTHSITLAILDSQGRAIGTISLSHLREEEHSGRIGYWLGSSFWGRGYGSEAFALALGLALRLGITHLSVNIDADNIASRRIWRRYGAVEEEHPNGKVACTLDLSPGLTARAQVRAVWGSFSR